MKTASLIEKLITIAAVTKKDLAAAVSLSPSGLSRFLTGQHSLDLRDHKNFSLGSAQLLASAIYKPSCFIKLTGIFPFIYDFSSKNDLEIFLYNAISYTLEHDFAVSNEIFPDYQDKDYFYYNHRQVLNMTCIILSDILQTEKDEALEFYSTLPFLFRELPYSLNRIVFTKNNRGKIKFNQSLSCKSDLLSKSASQISNPFGIIHQLELNFDLYFWEKNQAPQQQYLLLKDHCLLIYDSLPDAAPTLKLIRNKNYLQRFSQFIEKSWGRKLSFNRNEANQILDADPTLLSQLTDRDLQAIYTLAPVGYVLKPDEMEAVEKSPERRERLHQFFTKLINSGADIYVSGAAIGEFVRSGKAILPLSGITTIPKNRRIEIMQRLETQLSPEMKKRSQVIYTSMSSAVILCSRDLTFLYMVNQDGSKEKIHLFFVENAAAYLEEDFRKKQFRLLEYSDRRWQAYIDEVRSRLH